MHLKQKTLDGGMLILTGLLAIFCLGIVLYVLFGYPQKLEGRLLPSHLRGKILWKTITAEDIIAGTSVPADINVIIHIPFDTEDIPRKTLFGRRGETVRYWGYCFPDDPDEALELQKRGFPGRLFLSEAERDARRELERLRRRNSFSVYDNLNDQSLNETDEARGRIRHQKEIFEPGESCYVMTEEPLPIGLDVDGDNVNSILELEWGSDPKKKDTDEDGLDDDIEIFLHGTNPTIRDTDGDGIIDGIEDTNRNGYTEYGETDPKNRDSDRDGLCDGLCVAGKKGERKQGEDVNLNGIVDDGELDPRLQDSDGNGILDEQEYFNCVLFTDTRDCNYSAFPVE